MDARNSSRALAVISSISSIAAFNATLPLSSQYVNFAMAAASAACRCAMMKVLPAPGISGM